MHKVSIIPYSCGAGAQDKTCADAPAALRSARLAEALQGNGISASWIKEELPLNDDASSSDAKIVTTHCLQLKNNVQDILRAGGFPLTIGGDHSMAMGTWTGVADVLHSRRKLGLIWVDAHMDAHTQQTSHSGNRHGMPISYLLGCGDDSISDITGRKPVIVPEQLCLIGIRSFEVEEESLLKSMGVKIFTMDDIRKRGLDEVMLEAVKIASAHTAGFGMSIDVDAFDPSIAPGTGTVEPGGILKDEFISAINSALPGYTDRLLALEIAEYNPHLDKNNITADLIKEIVAAVLLA